MGHNKFSGWNFPINIYQYKNTTTERLFQVPSDCANSQKKKHSIGTTSSEFPKQSSFSG